LICGLGPDGLPEPLAPGPDGLIPRVGALPAARDLIARLKAEHGDLLFHQSGGCCDGSAPMCYPAGEFRLGARDVKLGEIDGCPVYISGSQFERWEHTQLVLDAVPGRGASFSLEIPLGLRFLTRSRVYTAAERTRLAPVARGQ
jgi:uncharacterized protein (DUF779 family)